MCIYIKLKTNYTRTMALQLRAKSFILHEMLTFQESMEIDFLNKTQGIIYLGFPYLY